MRNELELIEKIEQYLNGQLSADEKAAFEAQLAADPSLRGALRYQQDILSALDRVTAQQAIRRARRRFYQIRYLVRWGGLGLGVIVIICAIFYFHRHAAADHIDAFFDQASAGQVHHVTVGPADTLSTPYSGDSLPPVNESGDHQWVAADSLIKPQTFWINASTDTVVETNAGILFSIPAGGFLDRNGAAIKGRVELIVKEALDPATIIKAGLSTLTNHGEQSLLETGGMFFLDARKKGQSVKINPNHAIYVQIPTNRIQPRMQLFTGQRTRRGAIDWVNPQPLNHDLIPIDINLLNFYPPHFLDSLRRWGYNSADKTFTDSLYYSFARLFSNSVPGDVAIQAVQAPPQPGYLQTDTLKRPQPTDAMATTKLDTSTSACAINPAKVKAIWNLTFQNTLLSTRNFEQRMALIHQSGDDNLLDLYVDYLYMDLSGIDSLAASRSTGTIRHQFLAFAARKDGKIKNGVPQLDQLRKYYQEKTAAFMEAITKTQNDFWNKQARLDNLADTKQISHRNDSINRLSHNLEEEFRLNYAAACAQIGYKPQNPSFSGYTYTGYTVAYTAVVTGTGWCNIDRYTEETTIARQSAVYTDQQTGRQATLTYQPVSVQLRQLQQYSRIYVYLLPDRLNSFMRLSDSTGKFAERINQLMTYRLICIGYKNEKAFFYTQANIQSRDYTDIPLNPVSDSVLDQQLNALGNRTQAADLRKETEYFQFEIRDQKRQQRNQALHDLADKIYRAFFPCFLFPDIEAPRQSKPSTPRRDPGIY